MIHIILDTSFFIANKYTAGKRIHSLSRLSDTGEIKLYITSIIYEEVMKHIASDYQEIKQSLNNNKFSMMDMLNDNYRKDYLENHKFQDFKDIFDKWI